MKLIWLVSAATKTAADKDEDGGNDQKENEELSPAKTVVSTHRDPSFCKFCQSGYGLSGGLIPTFPEAGSDKDKDGGNDEEENKELSPSKTVVSAHKNTSFQRISFIICELISFSETRSDKDEDGCNHKKENKELSPAKTIIPTHG